MTPKRSPNQQTGAGLGSTPTFQAVCTEVERVIQAQAPLDGAAPSDIRVLRRWTRMRDTWPAALEFCSPVLSMLACHTADVDRRGLVESEVMRPFLTYESALEIGSAVRDYTTWGLACGLAEEMEVGCGLRSKCWSALPPDDMRRTLERMQSLLGPDGSHLGAPAIRQVLQQIDQGVTERALSLFRPLGRVPAALVSAVEQALRHSFRVGYTLTVAAAGGVNEEAPSPQAEEPTSTSPEVDGSREAESHGSNDTVESEWLHLMADQGVLQQACPAALEVLHISLKRDLPRLLQALGEPASLPNAEREATVAWFVTHRLWSLALIAAAQRISGEWPKLWRKDVDATQLLDQLDRLLAAGRLELPGAVGATLDRLLEQGAEALPKHIEGLQRLSSERLELLQGLHRQNVLTGSAIGAALRAMAAGD